MEITKSIVYGWIHEVMAANQRVYYSNDVINVSEITGCLRKSYYTRLYPLRPREAISLVIMSFGNGIHSQLQEHLTAKGWMSEVEVSWDLRYFRLVGHADLYHPGKNIVIELKTTSRVPDKPYHSHIMQLNSYQAMLRAEKGYLIYIARDGRVEVYPHKYDKQLWNQTIKRAFHYYFSLQKKRTPKPEPSPLCKYCPFKWKCYQEKGDDNYGR